MVAKCDQRASEMLFSRRSRGWSEFVTGLGFAATRESAGECGNSGQGKSEVLRVALIWVLRSLLAKAELGTSKPSYDGSVAVAVTAITVLGDGIG